jgi:hypothetical protein
MFRRGNVATPTGEDQGSTLRIQSQRKIFPLGAADHLWEKVSRPICKIGWHWNDTARKRIYVGPPPWYGGVEAPLRVGQLLVVRHLVVCHKFPAATDVFGLLPYLDEESPGIAGVVRQGPRARCPNAIQGDLSTRWVSQVTCTGKGSGVVSHADLGFAPVEGNYWAMET